VLAGFAGFCRLCCALLRSAGELRGAQLRLAGDIGEGLSEGSRGFATYPERTIDRGVELLLPMVVVVMRSGRERT
jgi:hypothetical protein